MVMKNKAFVRLPVSEVAKAPWDTVAVERRDAVWRNFDASFKEGVEVTRPTPIVQEDESPNSIQPEQVTSLTVHRSYLKSRKAKPSFNSC